MLDTDVGQIERFRQTNRDLAACLALPALWANREPAYILATLLDMLVSMLQLDLVHAAVLEASGKVAVEESRPTERAAAAWTSEVLRSWPAGDDTTTATLPAVGDVRVARVPFRFLGGDGVVLAVSTRCDFPSQRDTILLRAAVDQAAIALNNAHLAHREQALLESEQAARREAEAAFSVLQRLEAVMEGTLVPQRIGELLGDLVARTRTALDSDTAVILLLDDDASLIPVASHGFHEELAPVPVLLGSGVAGHIAASDAGLIVDDLEAVDLIRSSLRERIHSLVGAPLKLHGRLIGVIHVGSTTPRQFTPSDLRFLRMVADRAALAIERVRLDEAEQAARAKAETTAQQLRMALEAGHMGIAEWAIDTGEVEFSPELEAVFGYAPGASPRTFEDLLKDVHADDRDRVLQDAREAVEQRQKLHFEYRIVCSDGTVRWVEGHAQPLLDADGRCYRMVGLGRDVTERKQVEERFQLAVEAAPTAMIIADQHGTILLVNALTEQLLGYPRQELIGRSVDRLVPLRFRDRHAEYRAGFSSDLRRRPMGAGRDLYALRKDGSEVPVEIGLSPFETADGVFVLAAVTDITERKLAEQERAEVLVREQAARQELERASRLKDEFLAVLSHELRTPLNAIVGWAHLLATGELPVERALHAVEVIERNAKAESQLLDSLLDLSRIMAGKLRVEVERVDLSSVVHAAADTLRPAADQKRVALELVVPPSPVVIVGDAGRLQQVVWNLLSNAVKFTPTGGWVGLRLAQEGSQAEIQVSDNGEGIGADFLPYVFDRFTQADRAREHPSGGLGLGLAIVRELVHAHGGSILVESAGEGYGATFTVKLPVPAMAIIPGEPEEVSGIVPEAMVDSIGDFQVLIVDDDADARDLLALALESRGACVRMASSAWEALDSIERNRPDVLLADIRLPQEDGYSLIRKVRALEKGRSVRRLRAIAVTAYASSSDREQAIAAGYDGHLAKPVEPDRLVQAVAKLASPFHDRTDREL